MTESEHLKALGTCVKIWKFMRLAEESLSTSKVDEYERKATAELEKYTKQVKP